MNMDEPKKTNEKTTCVKLSSLPIVEVVGEV